MKKAVISNRIYMDVEPHYQEKLKKELTYIIPGYSDLVEPTIIRNYGIIRPGLVTLPVGRTDLIPEGYEIVERRITKPVEFPAFRGTLRESQQAIHDSVSENCIINAKPGWGKTFAGLAIARKLAQKTLILVHNVPLRNQWAREVNKVFGFEPGIIGSGQFNTTGPIVVSNSQTLYNCIDRVCKDFGTIIHDEMHHASAPTFSRILDKCYARYKIGLSGTVRRKDGKDVVFKDYFGDKIYKPEKENVMTPVVHAYNTGVSLPDAASLGWAAKVTMLQESIVYRQLVMALVDKYVSEGHKVLIVSDRVAFLEECAKSRNTAYATGSNAEDRERVIASVSEDTDELWGTLSIFKEGIDQVHLSCVILATPINNEPMLEQVVNRIMRKAPGKLTPVVVDLKLMGKTASKQFTNRMGFYLKQGWKVKHIQ